MGCQKIKEIEIIIAPKSEDYFKDIIYFVYIFLKSLKIQKIAKTHFRII